MSQTRREFIKTAFITSIFFTLPSGIIGKRFSSLFLLDDDERICKEKFNIFIKSSLKESPIGDVITQVGTSFIDTDYAAGTLEINPDAESIVINLTGFDCVTFAENCLTFARCLKANTTSFEDYKKQLEIIRYRNGVLDGYASRLHYFTDWIYDNEEKGIVRDITRDLGGDEYQKKIDFMSKHPSFYKQLSGKRNLKKIKSAEEAINGRARYFISKESISGIYGSLKNGDIVATTTNIAGLDVTHTGYVYKGKDGGTYFLHASLKSKKVIISDNQLQEYVMEDPKKTGIIVARPLEV